MFKYPVIVFEGVETSGKTTNLNIVKNYLKKKNIKYLKIREPGGNKNSEKIRNLILDKKINFNRNTDLLLYLAARSENIELIKKNFKKKVILIDRFVDSTIAYQHYGFGVNLKLIKTINKYLIKDIKVNFTFLNIVNKKNMITRIKKRKILNRYDKFSFQFYKKVQDGFLKLSKEKNRNYQIIDSNLDILLNKKIILSKIDKLIYGN